jgi:RND superfamily putative drug exporter
MGRFTYRRRWPILLFWAVVLVTAALFAPKLGGQLKGGGFEGSGRDSELAKDLMVEEFGLPRANLAIVFESDDFSAGSEGYQRAEDEALEPLRNMEEIRSVATYADTKDRRFLSDDGNKTYALVGFNVSADETQSLVDEVRRKVRSEELTTYVTGPSAVYLDITNASAEDIRRAEKYAFPLALVILVIAFGTLVAAGIPILIGGVSVLTALAALYFLAGVYDMSVYVLSIATMLGLGLGIDYALFAVSRFREELENYPIPEAVSRMVATAGRSIFFSGLAVLIGLSGLLFFPFMFIRSIGVAGVLVVFVSVSASLTLLPAVLGVLGHKVNALAVRRNRGAVGAGFWGRSAEAVMRHPLLVILIVGVMLSALLYPATHMKIGISEASALPDEYESRAGDDILRQDFDYASLSPMQIVATVPEDPLSPEGLEDVDQLGERVRETDGVQRVESIYTVGESAAREYAEGVSEARKEAEAEADRSVEEAVQGELENLRSQYGFVPPGTEGQIRAEAERRAAAELERKIPELPEGVSASGEISPQGVANFLKSQEARDSEEVQDAIDPYVEGDRTLLRATTEANPYTEAAREAVGDVRSVEPPEGVSYLVGGLSAGQKDFISSVYDKAPYAAAFVLGVTYLVLLYTFRSVFIPLKAVAVNILSLTASFGAMVFVFQDGNFSDLLNFTPPGFVDATLPILIFCTVFGVSMDYEVFLLSRIREAYENGDSNTASVAKGLVSTAGIITSAAAIIVVVTGAFAFSSVVITKAVGLGLAVAVFVDATIIRVLLVPATMRVLGDWNWWPGGRKSTFGNEAYIDGAARVGPQDEANARPALLPVGMTGYLYLGSAVVLVLAVAAAALAPTTVGDGRPAVSQVRQPLIPQAPEISPSDVSEEDARTQHPSVGDAQRANDEDSRSEETTQRSQPEQGQGDSSQAQVPASTTASASTAAVSASASAAAVTASASAAAVSAPATAEPGATSSVEATEVPDEPNPVSVRPPASAPPQGTAPPSSSPAAEQPTAAAPSGGTRNPPAGDEGGLEVPGVGVDAEDVEDPVEITGVP